MATFFDQGSLPPRLGVQLTQQQEHALFMLKDEDDRVIRAYLGSNTSIGSDMQSCINHAALPKKKVDAIEVLKTCLIDVLLAGLRTARRSGKRNTLLPLLMPCC